jgi:SRSO17 transposase
MCPLYVAGLIGPGDRKSVGPIAERMAPDDYDQLHHFVSDGVWDEAPLGLELANQADKLVGGADAVLVIDDTTLPKKGTHSVGVAPQYASALGKTANCQTLVSLTLAKGEVPAMVGLRLFLPETWTGDQARLERAGVPAEYRSPRTKSEIALAELDRLIAAGVRFGAVLADAGYGMGAEFRQALSARGLAWRSAFPATRRSTRARSNSCFPSPDAAARASGMCRMFRPSPPKTCSAKQSGACSVGARGRRVP